MKKQKGKLSIKVRDLEPLKDVTGGRHRHHRLQSRTYQWVWNPSGAGKWDYWCSTLTALWKRPCARAFRSRWQLHQRPGLLHHV